MRNLILLLSILIIFSQDAYAQQDSEYTQYMFNPQLFNPAYVISG